MNYITEAIKNLRQAAFRSVPTAIICEPLKLCYYSIPKVGSSTVKRYLIEHGYANLPVDGAEIGMGNIHGYLFPRTDRSGILKLNGFLRFAVVRDPYRRIWSCYVDKIVRNRESGRPIHPGFERYNRLLGLNVFNLDMSFTAFLRSVSRIPDWMADGHFRSQHRFIASQGGNLLVDRFVRLENLDEEMSKLTLDRALPSWDAPKINPSKAGAKSFDWTELEINLVNRRYARDFMLFKYDVRRLS
jgi:hypothetical protein